jgi:hypothetical protein
MKYAAIVVYTPDASTIAKARPAHREYLTGLFQQERSSSRGHSRMTVAAC